MTLINTISLIISIILINNMNLTNANDLNDINEQISNVMNPSASDASASSILHHQQSQQQLNALKQQQQQQQQQQNNNELEYLKNPNMKIQKRSWQNLQGSWGKRGDNILSDIDSIYGDGNFDDDYNNGLIRNNDFNYPSINDIINEDPLLKEYDDALNNYAAAIIATKYLLENTNNNNNKNGIDSNAFNSKSQQLRIFPNEQKRGWKSMSGAWGKRLSNGDNWNRFRGSWGKREPGWNNLKGLWGKRATNWSKLQNAWGKRSDGEMTN